MEEKTIGIFEASVTEENTALAMGSGSLPVLATPAMVAMMEHAAVNALEGHLPEGIDSVGIAINVEHLAASPVGAMIRTEAHLTAADGRTYDNTLGDNDCVLARSCNLGIECQSQNITLYCTSSCCNNSTLGIFQLNCCCSILNGNNLLVECKFNSLE